MTKVKGLGFLHYSYLNTIQNLVDNSDEISTSYAIEVISGLLRITDNTLITNQDYFLLAIASTLEVDNMIVKDINASQSLIVGFRSTITISNSVFTNYYETDIALIRISTSRVEISNVTYSNSTTGFLLLFYSEANLDFSINSVNSKKPLMSIRFCESVSISNAMIDSVNSEDESIIDIHKSVFPRISNFTIMNTQNLAMKIESSTITEIDQIQFENCTGCLNTISSSIQLLTNSFFKE